MSLTTPTEPCTPMHISKNQSMVHDDLTSLSAALDGQINKTDHFYQEPGGGLRVISLSLKGKQTLFRSLHMPLGRPADQKHTSPPTLERRDTPRSNVTFFVFCKLRTFFCIIPGVCVNDQGKLLYAAAGRIENLQSACLA